MVTAPLSAGCESLPPLPTIKLGPSGSGSRVGGLVHALGPCGSLQRPLLWGWEFLLLLPQPPRVFSIRGLRLYFCVLEPWVMRSASLPTVRPGLSVHECNVEGSARGQTACPIRPTLRQSRSRQGNASPLHPGCLSPPLLLVWMNVHFFISLVSDFLAVRYSVSSGCERRRSVSTYAAILVLPIFAFSSQLYFIEQDVT